MNGVIAGGSRLTVSAGKRILEIGGNAVDAAVASAFASFICEIGVVQLGGSGVAQIYDPQIGKPLVYDFFSNMPGLGKDSLPTHLDFTQVTVDFISTTQDFFLGRGAVAVPGNIFGLCLMQENHGRLPLPQVIQPALELARDGILINKFQSSVCRLLNAIYTNTKSMRDVFIQDDHILLDGDRLFIPHLHKTLVHIAYDGADHFRNGDLSYKFLNDQAAYGGIVNHQDLQNYQVNTLDPIHIRYRDHDIMLPGGSSMGGILVAFTLKLLSQFKTIGSAPNSPDILRLLYEVFSATTRARAHFESAIRDGLADSLVSELLADTFIQQYADEVQTAIRDNKPSVSASEKKGPNATSHLSVIDSDGMAVAITTTAGESAGYIVPQTGFIPNNMLGEADLHPHGWHAWPAGVRIPTMMTPTLVLKDGDVRLVLGTGGSARIRSAIVQVISNLLDHKLPLQEAVNAPRVHVEDGVLQCELGYLETAVSLLEQQGYPVNRWHNPSMYFGGAHSVARAPDGSLTPAGDPRRDGRTAVS